MRSDADVLAHVSAAFCDRVRPEHFTNFEHCSECAEHDEVLRSRSLETLGLSDVGNPGWDPICFITPSGFAYFLPALVRIAFLSRDDVEGWYVPQLLFHLCHDGPANARVQECTASEREAVIVFLDHISETRTELVNRWSCADQLFEALRYWSDEKKA
jgi:hypothetical protein